MNDNTAADLARRFLAGELPLDDLRAAFAGDQVAELTDASLDLDRERRCGYPEVIYAPGKSIETLRRIVAELIARHVAVLVTRLDADQAAALVDSFPYGQ